jgi:uncharacterized membrane protein
MPWREEALMKSLLDPAASAIANYDLTSSQQNGRPILCSSDAQGGFFSAQAHPVPFNQTTVNPMLIASTAAALLTLLPVAAHQLGGLDHLPDPPGAIFASDEITASKAAHPLGVPDSLPGLASYSLTLTLALLAPSKPKLRKLLALKLIADGTLAGVNMVRQIVTFGKLCSWCTGTALCTAAMLLTYQTRNTHTPRTR